MNIHRALSFLACPRCGKRLQLKRDYLTCASNHRFDIREGIPIFYEVRSVHHKHQEHYFENFYAQYDRLPELNWHQSYWELASQDLEIKPGKLLADVGGGIGWFAIAAARAGCQAVVVDLTLDIVRKAKQFATKAGVADKMFFVVADAEHLPFQSNRLDYLAAIAIIEHLPGKQRAAREFVRVLKRRGKLWIVTPNDLNVQPIIFKLIFHFWDKMLGHFHHYSFRSLNKLLKPYGALPYSYRYIGHMVKLWQFLLHAIFRNNRLWWWLEKFERNQHLNPASINIAVAFEKRNYRR